MKKNVLFLLAGLVVIAFSCTQISDLTPEEQLPSGPVTVTVSIDSETKATLAEETGAFAFSSGDAIKIFNGSAVYAGTTTSTDNSGKFTMEDGFTATGSGYAGFPASMVSAIDGDGVKFTLPDSYVYSEVGSSDANAAIVPCPMIGTYTAGQKISLKQAGALIRFRVTNVAAGSLVFSFPTNVTGTMTNAITTPSGTNDGILANNLVGKVITVSGVPNVASGSYIYITLPVPTGTKSQNITVMNIPSSKSMANRKVILDGNNNALDRAAGFKMGATLTDITAKNLSSITEPYVAQNGETLTGELKSKVKISIAAGATVIVEGVFIYGSEGSNYQWAGLTCVGDATIILRNDANGSENTIKGFEKNYPGIQAGPAGTTLTLLGPGKLTALSSSYGAGIGGGRDLPCGNIEIKGGNILAQGSHHSAGIGAGNESSCGNITITGGTIQATGSYYSAGIGGGNRSSCGNITITDGVTQVTAATSANYPGPNSIGAGQGGSCGTVTIGGVETGNISTSPYTYTPQH